MRRHASPAAVTNHHSNKRRHFPDWFDRQPTEPHAVPLPQAGVACEKAPQ
jgi:hypothetical protein